MLCCSGSNPPRSHSCHGTEVNEPLSDKTSWACVAKACVVLCCGLLSWHSSCDAASVSWWWEGGSVSEVLCCSGSNPPRSHSCHRTEVNEPLSDKTSWSCVAKACVVLCCGLLSWHSVCDAATVSWWWEGGSVSEVLCCSGSNPPRSHSCHRTEVNEPLSDKTSWACVAKACVVLCCGLLSWHSSCDAASVSWWWEGGSVSEVLCCSVSNPPRSHSCHRTEENEPLSDKTSWACVAKACVVLCCRLLSWHSVCDAASVSWWWEGGSVSEVLCCSGSNPPRSHSCHRTEENEPLSDKTSWACVAKACVVLCCGLLSWHSVCDAASVSWWWEGGSVSEVLCCSGSNPPRSHSCHRTEENEPLSDKTSWACVAKACVVLCCGLLSWHSVCDAAGVSWWWKGGSASEVLCCSGSNPPRSHSCHRTEENEPLSDKTSWAYVAKACVVLCCGLLSWHSVCDAASVSLWSEGGSVSEVLCCSGSNPPRSHSCHRTEENEPLSDKTSWACVAKACVVLCCGL